MCILPTDINSKEGVPKQSFRGATILGGMHMKRNWLDVLALILVIIGGINWGLVGFFKFDLVSFIFGDLSMITRIIFAIVGIAAIYSFVLFWKLKTEDN